MNSPRNTYKVGSVAFKRAWKRAESGDHVALVEVACSLQLSKNSSNTEETDAVIENILLVGARQDFLPAIQELVLFYSSDRTHYKIKSKKKAREWRQIAASLGDPDSMTDLGLFYMEEKNWITGQEWLMKSAQSHDRRAILSLAEWAGAQGQSEVATAWMVYLHGDKRNFPEHLRLLPKEKAPSKDALRDAAAKGDFDAMAELGQLAIRDGNWILGQEWLLKAAKLRNKNAILALVEWSGSEGHSDVASGWMDYLDNPKHAFPLHLKLVPADEASPENETPSEDRPGARLIRTPREAEEVACEWLRFFGFTDAETTTNGRDGGVDVDSENAVVQVKFKGVPTGSPEVHQLYGVASLQRKIPFFFSLGGFTAEAKDFSEQAGIALFSFDYQGTPIPVSSLADKYLPTA